MINTSRRNSRAFTLVELLVVIGIIAVLIGILLPSLQSARRQAMAVKCASQLRECGAGIQMYASDNKGVLPPAQLQTYITGNVKYNIDGIDYPVSTGTLKTQPMWTAFIAKYLQRGKGGMAYNFATDPNFAAGDARRNSIFWCPSWDGYPRPGIPGQDDVVMWQTGYGYNFYLTKKPNETLGASKKNFLTNWGSTATSGADAPGGTWIKTSQATSPAERMLLSDCQFWNVDSYSFPTVSTRGIAQKLPNNSQTWSASPYNAGQITVDWYRHGKYPALQNGGTQGNYRAEGGRVSYNILYVDGHVAQSAGKDDSYKGLFLLAPPQ